MTAFDTVKKTPRTHARTRTQIHILATEMLLNVSVEQQMDIMSSSVAGHWLTDRQTDRH